MSTKKKFAPSSVVVLETRMLQHQDFNSVLKLEALKNVTGYIDMGCDFEDGLCVKERANKAPHKESCCCYSCAGAQGYLNGQVLTDEQFKICSESYDSVTGFWRPSVGCILPRKHRSPTCVFYACQASHELLDTLYHLRRTYFGISDELLQKHRGVAKECTR